jgi:hypothetical protein
VVLVTLRCGKFFLGFLDNTSSVLKIGNLIFCGSSSVLLASILEVLILNICDLLFYSSIKCAILLVIKSFNSCFFYSNTFSSSLHLACSLSIQGFPMSMVNKVLSSTNLMISKSSFFEVPLTVIGIQVRLPHRFTRFPWKKLVLPREGIMAEFPIASQVRSGIMFTCASSSRVQSMSKSPIIASIFSFSLKISDSLTC